MPTLAVPQLTATMAWGTPNRTRSSMIPAPTMLSATIGWRRLLNRPSFLVNHLAMGTEAKGYMILMASSREGRAGTDLPVAAKSLSSIVAMVTMVPLELPLLVVLRRLENRSPSIPLCLRNQQRIALSTVPISGPFMAMRTIGAWQGGICGVGSTNDHQTPQETPSPPPLSRQGLRALDRSRALRAHSGAAVRGSWSLHLAIEANRPLPSHVDDLLPRK